MKKILFVFALLIGTASFYNSTQAQVSVNINVGRQPAWGPVGYDYAQYYYLPDIDSYYDINSGMFYYADRGGWISARYLPSRYAHYDLYGMYKVVLNTRNPWLYNRNHRVSYAQYRGYRNQYVIRDSRDARYRDSRYNHVAWNNSGPSTSPSRPSYNNRPDNKKYESNRNSNKHTNNNNNNRPGNSSR